MQLDLLAKPTADPMTGETLSMQAAESDVKEPAIAAPGEPARDKSPEAFKNIAEVAGLLEVQQYVLRFWESRFSQIKPVKMRGGRRYYRPEDIEVLQTIKNLLYKQGYTIKGAKKALSGQHEEVKEPKHKTGLSEKQINQLSVIRHELIGMREVLKPYVF